MSSERVDEQPKPQPWERQTYETATQFRRFTDYYLSQSPPRSIDQAYRDWRQSKRGSHAGCTSDARVRVSGTWQRWAQARDRYDQKIPGGRTWTERVAAWDDHVAELARAELARRETEVLSQGYAQYIERVKDLDALARLLRNEIYEQDKRWLPDVKQIGQGPAAERVDIVRFNAALIREYRETLDDIAAELGQRIQNLALTGTVGVAAVTADEMAEARERAEAWRAQRFGRADESPEGKLDG